MFFVIYENFFAKILGNIVFVIAALTAGLYYRTLTSRAHRKTFAGTSTIIESRIKLECEKEQQEQLLLSVIPAYIAAEVNTIVFINDIENKYYSRSTKCFFHHLRDTIRYLIPYKQIFTSKCLINFF